MYFVFHQWPYAIFVVSTLALHKPANRATLIVGTEKGTGNSWNYPVCTGLPRGAAELTPDAQAPEPEKWEYLYDGRLGSDAIEV